MNEDFRQITIVSVTGLADTRGAVLALAHSQAQMPGSQALLCSPNAPADLPAGILHRRIAPMNYQEYSWFMLFALWRVISTEFALVVQEDGWVVNSNNWQSSFLDHDYVGAPIHLARVSSEGRQRWSERFEWSPFFGAAGHEVVPVQNGGFSLRSRALMRAFVDHPQIRVETPVPQVLGHAPDEALRMHWPFGLMQEDVQLTGVLRPALEEAGLRFAPVDTARAFSIEYAGHALHHGWNAMQLFGHHARTRRLTSLHPLTLSCTVPESALDSIYGERDVLTMFERNGYRIEFAAQGDAAPAVRVHGAPSKPQPAPDRKVYDCFTYNGEDDVLAIRLHELADVVDCFVIVEAAATFDGSPKALRFNPDDPRFAAFKPRMRYVAVHDMPDNQDPSDTGFDNDWLSDSPSTGHWQREKFQRNQIMRGLWDAALNDLIMISDIDEIPRAQVVRAMRSDSEHDQFALSLAFFYFYANYRCVSGPEAATIWTVASTFLHLQTTTPDRLRMGLRHAGSGALVIGDAGWHLSYLGMSDEDVRRKIATFAHQEYNTPAQMAAVDISAITAEGRDLFARPGYAWEICAPDDAPAWLTQQDSLSRLFLA